MIKLNDTASSNLTVLPESDLTQVVGGCGYRRSYRRRHHCCWGRRPRHDYGRQGFEARGFEGGEDFSDDRFESPSSDFEASDPISEDPAAAPAA